VYRVVLQVDVKAYFLLQCDVHSPPQVESSSAEVSRARSSLEEVRTGGKHTTQRQLDSAQAELREAVASGEVAKEVHDQVGGVGTVCLTGDVCQQHSLGILLGTHSPSSSNAQKHLACLARLPHTGS
jgi:hypothetical protein